MGAEEVLEAKGSIIEGHDELSETVETVTELTFVIGERCSTHISSF